MRAGKGRKRGEKGRDGNWPTTTNERVRIRGAQSNLSTRGLPNGMNYFNTVGYHTYFSGGWPEGAFSAWDP